MKIKGTLQKGHRPVSVEAITLPELGDTAILTLYEYGTGEEPLGGVSIYFPTGAQSGNFLIADDAACIKADYVLIDPIAPAPRLRTYQCREGTLTLTLAGKTLSGSFEFKGVEVEFERGDHSQRGI